MGALLVVVVDACTDEAGWADTQNDSCAIYVNNTWCTSDGQEGSGWNSSLGNISEFAAGGMDALQACCGCGGGTPAPSPSPSPSPRSPATTTTNNMNGSFR